MRTTNAEYMAIHELASSEEFRKLALETVGWMVFGDEILKPDFSVLDPYSCVGSGDDSDEIIRVLEEADASGEADGWDVLWAVAFHGPVQEDGQAWSVEFGFGWLRGRDAFAIAVDRVLRTFGAGSHLWKMGLCEILMKDYFNPLRCSHRTYEWREEDGLMGRFLSAKDNEISWSFLGDQIPECPSVVRSRDVPGSDHRGDASHGPAVRS